MSPYQRYQHNSQEASNNAPNKPGCLLDILCSAPNFNKNNAPPNDNFFKALMMLGSVTIKMEGFELNSK